MAFLSLGRRIDSGGGAADSPRLSFFMVREGYAARLPCDKTAKRLAAGGNAAAGAIIPAAITGPYAEIIVACSGAGAADPAQTSRSHAASLDHLIGADKQRRRQHRPSALAVLRLTIRTNLVASSTGRSAGFRAASCIPLFRQCNQHYTSTTEAEEPVVRVPRGPGPAAERDHAGRHVPACP
jgi:hypothetical protein